MSSRIETVMGAVRARIAARADVPGSRLPSLRAQAAAMGVSVTTVVEAYERLVAEGLVTARRGSGFYVAGPVAPLALAAQRPPGERQIDPLWISRLSLEAGPQTLKPGCGWLPAAWLDEGGMRRALRAAARADAAVLADYATPLGHPALRELLSRRLATQGVDAAPAQIMLTESGTHAVDLICRFVLTPGDTVLLDDPCYFNFHALLRAHHVQVVGVPMTPNGPDVPAFAAALAAHAPRMYITNSGVHNPTGATLTAATAHRLLQAAHGSPLVIVEDGIFSDFEVRLAPRLAALDGLTRVIHIGSFSKTLSASLRCGHIAARADWIESLADLKIATSFGGGHLASSVLLHALTGSGHRKHLDGLRHRLALATGNCLVRLRGLGITPWLRPQAGMFIWCRLPHGASATNLARACAQAGVVLAPGPAFSSSPEADGYMRLNVAQATSARVYEVLGRAMRA